MEYIRILSDVLSLASSILFIWTMVKSQQKQVKGEEGYVEDVFGSYGSPSVSGESSEGSGDDFYDEDDFESSDESDSSEEDEFDEKSDEDTDEEFSGSVIAVEGNNAENNSVDTEFLELHRPNADLIDINSKVGVLLNSSVMWDDNERNPLFSYMGLPREEEAPQLVRSEEL